ncbi:MAG: hypothetical protein AAGI37_03705 [Planctomycetota bacterium]
MAEHKAKVTGTFEVTGRVPNQDREISGEKVEDFFYHYTGTVGNLIRQLALAGIAVIWLLHTNAVGLQEKSQEDDSAARAADVASDESPKSDDDKQVYDPVQTELALPLKWAACLIISGLFIEAMQYLIGGCFFGSKFQKGDGGKPISEFRFIIWCLLVAVVVKSVLVIAGLGAIAFSLRDLVGL